MITPDQVTLHLQTYLPAFTDLFSSQLSISGASMGASNVMSINAPSHGLTSGASVIVTAGNIQHPFASATLDAPNVIFTTTFEHDITAPLLDLDQQAVTVGGFGSVWDGEHQIVDIPNRSKITLALPSGETTAPTITGAEYVLEPIPSGQIVTVAVVDSDNLTITYPGNFPLPEGIVQDLKIITGVRIAAAADINRAQAVYTQQGANQAWLFVIMSDVDASKDRHTLSDATAGLTAQDFKRMTLNQNFSTTVILPTDNDLSGNEAQQAAYGEIYQSLISTLYGFGFSDPDSAVDYVTVSNGHGAGIYNTAYYMQVYDWQIPSVITFHNGFDVKVGAPTVAFRDIFSTWDINADDMAQMVLNINLDSDP